MQIHNRNSLELLDLEKDLDCVVIAAAAVAVVAAVAAVAAFQSPHEDSPLYIHSTYRHCTNNRPVLYSGRIP
jgi:hypothetical protein